MPMTIATIYLLLAFSSVVLAQEQLRGNDISAVLDKVNDVLEKEIIVLAKEEGISGSDNERKPCHTHTHDPTTCMDDESATTDHRFTSRVTEGADFVGCTAANTCKAVA